MQRFDCKRLIMTTKPVRFLLDDEEVSLREINPNMTVLNYLRGELNRTGTKEGCASGDCGACTAVVGELIADELHEGKIQYRSINTCITMLASLHGKQLITVENLKQGDALHSVQQSMVDNHGSQCGFCTPGFVMSMFALQKSHSSPTRDQVLEALGGNLCRCTGYRSIIDASLNCAAQADRFDQQEAETYGKLALLIDDETAEIECADHRIYVPKSISELAALLEENPDAKMVAGGTDLCLEITQNLVQFETLISTANVKELLQVTEEEDLIRIGAAANYSQFSDLLGKYFPQWGHMIERLGSLQIRNQGTLGGNIANASPIGDMPPVLIALGATMSLQRGKQTREIKVEDFFVDYKKTVLQGGEFITSISVPKLSANDSNSHLKVYKVSKRFDDDISAVLVAIKLGLSNGTVDQITVAYGGMAATPKRAVNCEKVLEGQAWNDANIELAMQALEKDFTPLSDVRASDQYRMQVAQNLLRRAFIETSSPDTETQVVHHA